MSTIVIFAVPAYALCFSLIQLKGGWDDGAITASFARTFATGGRFAVTPISVEVEGFSSLSWVLLLTPAHVIGRNSQTDAGTPLRLGGTRRP